MVLHLFVFFIDLFYFHPFIHHPSIQPVNLLFLHVLPLIHPSLSPSCRPLWQILVDVADVSCLLSTLAGASPPPAPPQRPSSSSADESSTWRTSQARRVSAAAAASPLQEGNRKVKAAKFCRAEDGGTSGFPPPRWRNVFHGGGGRLFGAVVC